MAAADSSYDMSALFPPFLRYESPTIVPGLIATPGNNSSRSPVITLLDSAGAAEGTPSSIPAAKLAAAKRTARETFLASQAPQQQQMSVDSRGLVARPDPTRRLPTPPVAGRRLVAGTNRAKALRKGSHTVAHVVRGDSRGTCMMSATHLETSQQQQLVSRDGLAALMRSAVAPSSFTANILSTLFPPLWRVVEDGDAFAVATGNGAQPLSPSSSSASRFAAHHPAGERPTVGPVSVQWVSRSPATREEVAQLHDALRHRLEERRAKPTDLCPIRREVYADVFAELVRQVTVEEPARGLLLQRIREESSHALAVHADLLARAHGFAARQNHASTRAALKTLRARIEALQVEKAAIEARKHELLLQRDSRERQIDEERLARQKARQEELAYLRRANQQLSIRLKSETERASSNSEHAAAATAR